MCRRRFREAAKRCIGCLHFCKYNLCFIQSIFVKFTDNAPRRLRHYTKHTRIRNLLLRRKIDHFKAKIDVTFQLRNIDKTISYVNIVWFVLDKTVLGLPKYTKFGTFTCLHL